MEITILIVYLLLGVWLTMVSAILMVASAIKFADWIKDKWSL